MVQQRYTINSSMMGHRYWYIRTKQYASIKTLNTLDQIHAACGLNSRNVLMHRSVGIDAE